MNEWFKKLIEQLKNLWAKWSVTQKIILASIAGVVLVAFILIISFSAAPSMVQLIGTHIQDEADLSRIVTRLDQEGARYQVTSDKRILVADANTARKMRAILIREDLIPTQTDPWAIFDIERWRSEEHTSELQSH